MDWIATIDYTTGYDEVKKQIAFHLPGLNDVGFNKYWTRSACGIKYDSRDWTFSVPARLPGAPGMKMAISAGLARDLVTLQRL